MTRQNHSTQKSVNPRKKKIFISWSGEYSKKIAIALKTALENYVFINTDCQCFVSDLDIAAGSDWWNKIKAELRQCYYGIICITKENVKAPWIHFEAGALISNSVHTIPLVINCNVHDLDKTPLSTAQAIDFYNEDKFLQMVKNINDTLQYTKSDPDRLNALTKDAYNRMKKELEPILKDLKGKRVINEKYIYPPEISTVTIKTIYISTPMASISEVEYNTIKMNMPRIIKMLEDLGFRKIVCPIQNISLGEFDGSTKAIRDNLASLKQVDTMLVIYPRPLPTSSLVEIGYGLALCKKMVIFHQAALPFILQDSGTIIPHIKTFSYNTWEDIFHTIKANGKELFDMED